MKWRSDIPYHSSWAGVCLLSSLPAHKTVLSQFAVMRGGTVQAPIGGALFKMCWSICVLASCKEKTSYIECQSFDGKEKRCSSKQQRQIKQITGFKKARNCGECTEWKDYGITQDRSGIWVRNNCRGKFKVKVCAGQESGNRYSLRKYA